MTSTTGRRRHPLAYVPLLLLLVAVVVATVAGREWQAPRRLAAGDLPRPGTSCRPPVPTPEPGPWRDPKRRPAAEAAFHKHIAKENAAYVAGKDGFVFFNDWAWDNFSQAIGRRYLHPRKLRAWARWITDQANAARRAGGEFAVIVSPANWDVYDEKLPQWAQAIRGRTSYEDLLQQYPRLPLIDVRTTLREHKSTAATYAALNSHWTPYGAYVAWDAAVHCLAERPGLGALTTPPSTGIDRIMEGSEFVKEGLRPTAPAWTVPRLAPLRRSSVTSLVDGRPLDIAPGSSISHELMPLHTVTPEAATDLTLLALRDSTSADLTPLWSRTFAQTWQYTHGISDRKLPDSLENLMREYKPDLTLVVLTERLLKFGPPADPGRS